MISHKQTFWSKGPRACGVLGIFSLQGHISPFMAAGSGCASAMQEEMLSSTALPVPLQVPGRMFPPCVGGRGKPMVPGDTVPSCLVAVLLMVELQGFFLCWQQRGDSREA